MGKPKRKRKKHKKQAHSLYQRQQTAQKKIKSKKGILNEGKKKHITRRQGRCLKKITALKTPCEEKKHTGRRPA